MLDDGGRSWQEFLSRNQNFEVRHLAGFVRVVELSVEYRTYFFSGSQPRPAEGICFSSYQNSDT